MGKAVVTTIRLMLVFVACAAVLSACGESDDEEPTPTATIRTSATTTPVQEESPVASAAPNSAVSPVAASPVPSRPTASPALVSDDSIQAEVQGATVVLTDFRVNVFQSSFEVGLPYTFVVQNNGGVTHEFVIERKGATDEPLVNGDQRAEIVEVPAGGQATLTWTFTEAGDYQIACHRAGHYERGMVQQAIVVGS